ncbi:MAG: Thermophilic metalloprotease superfamily [Candidatus Kaiserbacteria bacterium]|nr:Thermophilic metalloprotease superfamily [Candidatus Kaiserbacteria bacterium]
MHYTPSQKILERYANVLVNFALNSGKGIKKGDVVRVTASEIAKPLYRELQIAILKAGGHMVGNFQPNDTLEINMSRDYYNHAKPDQLDFFPRKLLKGMIEDVDHTIYIISETDPQALKGVDPKKMMRKGMAMKPFMDWRNEKENKGKFTWTIALYGTPAMAHEASLTDEEYWTQIIRACFLDELDPIKKWKQVYKQLDVYLKKINTLSPQIDTLHVEGDDADLHIKLGEKRKWLGGSGRNIPSFEIFTSPDCRGTNGWIRFNQPLYRYGNKIEGIEIEFKNGKVVKSSAAHNEPVLKQMIATEGANMVGEFSLTDKRFSRITKFMADTLFDENMGGPQGNTHIALGRSYTDCYSGNVAKLTKAGAAKLGYNDSSVHTDIVSTTERTVTAHLKNGTTKVIYKNGEFVL